MHPGLPGRATGDKQRSRGRFRRYRSKGRANQAYGQEHPSDPSCYGKGKGKDKGGKGKGKGKHKGDKGKSLKGAIKGKQKDSAKAASSSGDQANASPEACEASTPGWDEWHEDSYYADQGWSYATYEQQLCSYAAFASCRKARKKKTNGRTKGSKGKGADPNPRNNPVSNSYESYHS